MYWRIAKAVQAVLAHGLLFSFTILLVLKLDHSVAYSWWITFVPLWLFHLVVVRGRFSIPAPSTLNDRHWAPFHAVTAMPLLLAFELLLCVHLESNYDVNLKVVFFPLLAFQIAVLVDNIIMCRALMPGDEESMSDEAIWETLPHFWVAISMVFFIAATTFTVLKLCGDVAALGWWDLFINYGVAECFSFLNCIRWYNPAIHRHSRIGVISSSSANVGHFNGHPGAAVNSGEDDDQSRICSLQDVGGHIMKIPIVGFQILLFMRLEGTPSSAHNIPIPVLFSPLILMQGAVLFFSIFRLVEKCILLFNSGALGGRYLRLSSQVRDCFEFMNHGSRLLGWWSIDEVSHEEHARLYCASSSGYNTFSPEIVKKMPKAVLVKEISRLQAALSEQAEVTKCSQEEYERLQNEKILCRICFESHISIVLLPCRHHALCSSCCDKCKRCPICRVYIDDRLPVYDV